MLLGSWHKAAQSQNWAVKELFFLCHLFCWKPVLHMPESLLLNLRWPSSVSILISLSILMLIANGLGYWDLKKIQLWSQIVLVPVAMSWGLQSAMKLMEHSPGDNKVPLGMSREDNASEGLFPECSWLLLCFLLLVDAMCLLYLAWLLYERIPLYLV